MVTNEKGLQTDLVNPQLAHNDVVHCGGDLSPHIVVPAGVELQVNGTWGGTRTESCKDKATSQLLLLPNCNCRFKNDAFDFVTLNLIVKMLTSTRSSSKYVISHI